MNLVTQSGSTFPRENNWSYKHARRQWSLVDREDLKYKYLNCFDQAMVEVAKQESVLAAGPPRLVSIDTHNMVLVFEESGLLIVINFNVGKSLTGYRIGVPLAGSWQIVLSSDELRFGGGGHQDLNMKYPRNPEETHGFEES